MPLHGFFCLSLDFFAYLWILWISPRCPHWLFGFFFAILDFSIFWRISLGSPIPLTLITDDGDAEGDADGDADAEGGAEGGALAPSSTSDCGRNHKCNTRG